MEDKDLDYVVESLDDEETSIKAKRAIMYITPAVLAGVIILGMSVYRNSISDNKIVSDESTIESTIEEYSELNQEIEEDTTEEIKAETLAVSETEDYNNEDNSNTQNDYSNEKEIDYSNVDSFYGQIEEYRNQYGKFAESFQDKSDVMNLVNFIYLFDPTYDVESPITSQVEFDGIISDYYSSCLEHNIKPNLSSLFDNSTLFGRLLSESEDLVYKLKDSKNNDYTDENNYYIWITNNFINGDTAISQSLKNSVLIDLEREIFGVYYKEGDMYAAAKNQKNDYYEAEQKDVYYYSTNKEADEVKYGYYMCPNTAREVFGKFDTKYTDNWIVNNGSYPYQKVDENFDLVLNRLRVR